MRGCTVYIYILYIYIYIYIYIIYILLAAGVPYVVRIAAGLRLGVPPSQPHNCHQCGAAMDEYGIHGLHEL